VLLWSSNGIGGTGQAPTQLEITTLQGWLVRLAIELAPFVIPRA